MERGKQMHQYTIPWKTPLFYLFKKNIKMLFKNKTNDLIFI